MVIVQLHGIRALRLYRNDGGKHLAVHYGVVPFSYGELLDALRGLSDSKPFVEILELPALQWLAKWDFSLDRLVKVSEFLRYDYPPVYWFIVANSRIAGESVDGVINRKLLSRCLNVSALQSSQLAAMRRLKIEECCKKLVGDALDVLAKHWSLLKPFLVHEPEVDAACVCLLDIILDHIPDIHRCHWFAYGDLGRWFWLPSYSYSTGISIESAASLFLVEWFSLQTLGINPASLDSCDRMYYVIEREAQRLLRSGLFSFNQLNETVKSSINELFKAEVDEWINQQNDLIYNDYDDSAIWNDNDLFPDSQLRQMDSFFTLVTTAGELRSIASKLENCAASRVAVGMCGQAEFWIYLSRDDGELALLQLELKESDVNLTEFKGFQNAPVSQIAQASLDNWLMINRNYSKEIDDVA
jgi:hypothetical protein